MKKLADVKQDKTNPKNIVFSQSVKCQQQFIVNLKSVNFAKRSNKIKAGQGNSQASQPRFDSDWFESLSKFG